MMLVLCSSLTKFFYFVACTVPFCLFPNQVSHYLFQNPNNTFTPYYYSQIGTLQFIVTLQVSNSHFSIPWFCFFQFSKICEDMYYVISGYTHCISRCSDLKRYLLFRPIVNVLFSYCLQIFYLERKSLDKQIIYLLIRN